jgi:2-dehydropantoate 2-reductase
MSFSRGPTAGLLAAGLFSLSPPLAKVLIGETHPLCHLLDADNGIFTRSEAAANLGRLIVRECVALARVHGAALTEAEVMEQLMNISRGSDGALISTLQGIRAGRPTEIEFLNLAIAKLASSLPPSCELVRTEFLGQLVLGKIETISFELFRS